jgi:hypothetical protein
VGKGYEWHLCSSQGISVECDNLEEFLAISSDRIIWLAMSEVNKTQLGKEIGPKNNCLKRDKTFSTATLQFVEHTLERATD